MKEKNKAELELDINNNKKSFAYLYFLSLKTFLSSPMNVFLGFFLIIFTLFMWLLFKEDNPFLFASAVGALIVRNGIHTFYRNLSSHKTTGFSNRIDNTGLNNFVKPIANILANFTINFVIILILMALTLAFFKDQRTLFLRVNWYMFVFGTLSLWTLSVLISYTIYLFVKKPIVGTIHVSLLYILCYNLLGCAFPYEVIARIQWLNMVLYFLPPRYMLNVMQAGWVNAKNLNYEGLANGGKYQVDFKLGQNLAIPFIVTYGIILLLTFALITSIILKTRKMKFDIYGTSVIFKLSSNYIRDIKKSSSVAELQELRKKRLEETKLSTNYIKSKHNQKVSKEQRK